MRYTSQRGVSLLLLIIAITVFAGVAIGIVTLLRARYESYPYQVQSYQAYVLANAGVEFAIRYIKDNNVDPTASNSFFQNPAQYIPTDGTSKDFAFGNGKFSLRYVPGCPDMLYSKGTYGTATREVQLYNFSLYTGQQGYSVYMTNAAVTRTCIGYDCPSHTCYGASGSYPCSADLYPPGPPPGAPYPPSYNGYNGDRIQISYCNAHPSNANYTLMLEASSSAPVGLVAATQPVTLSRLGFMDNLVTQSPGHPLYAWWVFDATCGITGPFGGQGTPPYCPIQYSMGIYSCPSTTPGGGGPYAGRGLFDCVISGTTGYYNFPPLGALWDGTSNPPPAGVGYPYFWNTDTTLDASTQYDATCRPVVPCDASTDVNCTSAGGGSDLSQCNWLWDTMCNGQSPWPPLPPYAVATEEYSCFDDQTTCNMGFAWGGNTRSRVTCHFPMGGSPTGPPLTLRSFTLKNPYVANVNLNRITIETIGHLDSQIAAHGPLKMYLSFYTYLTSSTGNQQTPVQPPVNNSFIFTVH